MNDSQLSLLESLSQEVIQRIAADYPTSERDEVARVLLGYRVVPVNFGRMRILDAAKGSIVDLSQFVDRGNQYGQGWSMQIGGTRK